MQYTLEQIREALKELLHDHGELWFGGEVLTFAHLAKDRRSCETMTAWVVKEVVMQKMICDNCGKDYDNWSSVAITMGRKVATLILSKGLSGSWLPLGLCKDCVASSISSSSRRIPRAGRTTAVDKTSQQD